ncbi:MAG: protein kinase [Pirellulales bacterium]
MNTDPPQLESVFHEALSKSDAAERAAYLDAACTGNVELRARVDALLAAHAERGDFLGGTDGATVGFQGAHAASVTGIGTVVAGRYKLLEIIGEGGMGTVYMAEQTHPVRRKVAVKIIKPGMDSKGVLARFEAERQALALMDHPSIARVLDAGSTEQGLPFFAMELVKGTPITEFCDERRLSPRERLELFVPVCHAIQHAHQKGVIHRDIKPSNILVALYDDQPVPKVIDFGVAKATGQALTEHTLHTGFGAIIGTPEYMSPEQATFNQLDIDTRSDVYALGVLLYELLTGTTPVDKARLGRAAVLEVLRVVREEEPARPSVKLTTSEARASIAATRGMEPDKLSKLLRGELDWIVMKALEKERNRRYETAASLEKDVQRYLEDELVEARPPSVGYRTWRLIRKNVAAILITEFIILLLAGWISMMIRNNERMSVLVNESTRARLSADKQRKDADEQRWEAVEQRGLALAAKTEAMEAAQEASRAMLRAEENERTAKAALANEQQVSYANLLSLVHHGWQANEGAAAKNLLDAAPEQLRGWEWRYLQRLFAPEVLTLKSNGMCVAFSPDGKLVASGEFDVQKKRYVLKTWDADTGTERGAYSGFHELIQSVAFSSDGKRLAGGNVSSFAQQFSEVAVWDRDVGKEIFSSSSEDGYAGLALSPDGLLLALSEYRGGEEKRGGVVIYNLASGKVERTLPFFHHLAFSPDSKRLAGADRHGNGIAVWEVTDGKQQYRIVDIGAIDRICFSPDGKQLATANHAIGLESLRQRGEVRVFDASNGAQNNVFGSHRNYVQGIAFSPDSKRIASAGQDAVRVWNIEQGRELFALPVGFQPNQVAFHPDGKRLAVAGYSYPYKDFIGTIVFFDADSGPEARSLPHHVRDEQQLVVSADGKTIWTIGDSGASIKQWDAATGRELASYSTPTWATDYFATIALRTDGSIVALLHRSSREKKLNAIGPAIEIYDPVKGATVFSVYSEDKRQRSGFDPRNSAFSPDGKWLAFAKDESLDILDVSTGKRVTAFPPDDAKDFGGIRLSPDGHQILLGIRSAERLQYGCRLYDSATRKLLLSSPESAASSVLFSPDGKWLAVQHGEAIKIHDARTGDERFTLSANAEIWPVAISADSRRLATTQHIWDLTSGKITSNLKPGVGNIGSFNPDGSRLATIGSLGIDLWDTASGQRTFTLRGFAERPRALQFTPDGHRIITIADTIKIWDAAP